MLKRFIILAFVLIAFNSYCQQNSEYENAYRAYELGQIDESYIYLKRSLNDDPQHLPSKILMGEVLALTGYYTDAEIEFEEALSAKADPNLIIESFVRTLMALNNYQRVTEFSDAQLTPKKMAFLNSAKGIAYNLLNKPELAASSFEKALSIAPNSPLVLNSAAGFYLSNNNQANAATLLARSLAESNNIAETYQLYATLYSQTQEPDKQINALRQGLSIASDHPTLLRDLVTAYTSTGNFDGAKLAIEKTLNTSPNDPMGRLLYVWVLAKLNDNQLSQTILDELVSNLSLLDSNDLARQEDLLFVSAMANYAANNLEIARSQFEQFLSGNPNNFSAAKLLAEIYERKNSFIAAANTLERFNKRVEQDASVSAQLCRYYIQANQNHKCDLLLNRTRKKFGSTTIFIHTESRLLSARGKPNLALKSLERLPNDTLGSLAQKAIIAIQSNDIERATKFVDQLLELSKNNLDFLNLKASILKKQNNMEGATALYREILKQDNTHFAASFNLAHILYSTRNYAEAERITSRLVERSPSDPDVLILRARILTLLGQNEPAFELLSKAENFRPNSIEVADAYIDLYISNNELEKALNKINIVLKNDITNPGFIRTRAGIYNALGKQKEAQKDLKVLYGLSLDSFQSLYSLSATQAEFGDIEGSLITLERADQIIPNDFLVNRDIARILLKKRELTLALERIDILKAISASDPDVLLLQANLASINKDYSTAANFFNNAIRQSPGLAPALIASYQLALQGIGSDDFEKLFLTLSKDPISNVFATHLLSDYYYINNKLELAKKHYDSISRMADYRALPMVLNNLANIYITEKKLDTAYNFAQQAYDINPENSNILNTVGWINSLMGSHEIALDFLRKAFAMNAQNPNLRYRLAFTLHKLGRNDESKREIKTALNDFGDFTEREAALELQSELAAL